VLSGNFHQSGEIIQIFCKYGRRLRTTGSDLTIVSSGDRKAMLTTQATFDLSQKRKLFPN